MSSSNVADPRAERASELETEAQALRDQVEADRIAAFPKLGEQIRIPDQPRRVLGLYSRIVNGKIGVVIRSWPEQRELIAEFRNIPILCGECGHTKGYE